MLLLYDLLCDLVHPNLGSNLGVASVEDGKLIFGTVTKNVGAKDVFIQTFPLLLSVCGKEFGNYYGKLILMKIPPDELGPPNSA